MLGPPGRAAKRSARREPAQQKIGMAVRPSDAKWRLSAAFTASVVTIAPAPKRARLISLRIWRSYSALRKYSGVSIGSKS